MNQNFILAFILLVAFSVTNATQFQLCKPQNPLPVPTVTFNPDPLAVNQDTTFHISGTLDTDIYGLSIILEDQSLQQIDFAPYDVDPPAPAGTPFSFTADYKLDPSKTLPQDYTISIYLFDVEVTAKACALAFVGSCSSCL
ncbi:hypothetical protein C2G38_2248630 [Gigaspora rosea]|uniref:MD-2-related lipid-recognition domain-containing protein n=1 Tax=Gigaspora rosea TaxID=44941 RepID=A0A397UXB6_9GLOM|nr:hypothetical protein C2G38_2248630 [Gigaspora rosea]